MQLKLHGKKVQILESSYDPVKKRSRQKLFGSFPADTTTKYTVYNHVPDYNKLCREDRDKLKPLFEYNEKAATRTKVEKMELELEDLAEALITVDKITPRLALRILSRLDQIKETVKSRSIKRQPKRDEQDEFRFKKKIRDALSGGREKVLNDIGLLK